ncbi:phage baseplate assembly protein V, partial [Escherichia coli]|nr:phage baseplate assembly protein V [Escherichia coli]EFH8510090.1 phage baseplate assembly protein V [Escherichia coli]EFN8161022.1 phage baseplate assembly protein V [Escherichia coli]EHC5845616.1 phage baseplate assembly protein V [Escherichia coli]EIM5936157.1 phage baseplate assembly protein V [Escherichia coli]
RAGAFSVWVPPATGEQVAFVCIGGNPETAIIIGSLWSDDIPAPGSTLKEIIMTAPDGAVFRYDADAGALEVKGIKTASIQADTRITLDTSEVVCTRKLITATLEVQNGGEMRGSISHSGGSLTSNGITVHTHTHGGVRTGPGTTGGPQ